jgi:hypothetical protein
MSETIFVGQNAVEFSGVDSLAAVHDGDTATLTYQQVEHWWLANRNEDTAAREVLASLSDGRLQFDATQKDDEGNAVGPKRSLVGVIQSVKGRTDPDGTVSVDVVIRFVASSDFPPELEQTEEAGFETWQLVVGVVGLIGLGLAVGYACEKFAVATKAVGDVFKPGTLGTNVTDVATLAALAVLVFAIFWRPSR